MAFIRKIENFKCEHCGWGVLGNGYTNHCPHCLYSKHVDISPGDRKELCKGLMEPVGAEESGGEWSIIHKCQECGKIQKNRTAKEDDFQKVVEISSNNQKTPMQSIEV